MDESRKAFETWLMEEFGYRKDYLEYRRGEGDYKSHPDLRSRWQGWVAAWSASRAAVEIELPRRKAAYASGYGDGYLVDSLMGDALEYEETVDAIRAAGIKVKE
ncbi:hypothetical protein ACR9HT_17865 [Enterobacter wuhouensis]